MRLCFSKYHGAGNDFILIDDRTLFFPSSDSHFIQRLCQRRYGIGADGLILVQNSHVADLRMRIFNADGKETEMCGNGIRCLVHFTDSRGVTRIETMHAILTCHFEGENISVSLPNPLIQELNDNTYLLNTGVPHLVLFVEDLTAIDVKKQGKQLRDLHNANVNFVKVAQDKTVHVRTYERGVEEETHACGTAAAAVALTASKKHSLQDTLKILPLSQEPITVTIHNSEVQISGPASFVFQGELEIL